MRVGFLQFEPRGRDTVFNLRTVARVIEGEEFDLLVLPELCNAGYLLGSRETAAAASEPVAGGKTVRGLMELASRFDGYLVAGLIESDGGRIYNSAVLVGPEGVVHRHRKVHLARHEAAIFDRGDRFDVVEVRGAKVGLAVSFDIWMPEACRELARAGAEILACPAAYGGAWSMDVARVRAIENVVYVVSANRIGVESSGGSSVAFRGASQVIDCDGQVLCQAGKEECAVVVEIDEGRARVKSNVLCDDLGRELERYRE